MTDATSAEAAEEKLDFKRILPIFVIVLVDLMGLTLIIPLLQLFPASLGADAFTIGLLGAAYPAMQFLGAPILGRLSDKYGRKPVLVVSQIGTFIGFLVWAFAGGLSMLFLSRIIDGISGANIATAQAAITDSTTEKTRTQGLGLIGAAFGLGFVLGPIISGIMLALTNNNYRAPALAAAAFSLASILLTTFWFKETLPEEQRGQQSGRRAFTIGAMVTAVKHPAVGFLLLLIFAQQIAFGGFEHMLALFTLNRLGLNALGNSVIFVFVGIIVVAVQGGLIGRWSRAYGDRLLVIGALAMLAVGLLLVGLTPRTPVPWYSESALEAELSSSGEPAGGTLTDEKLAIEIPAQEDAGATGLLWILVAMVPVAVGGALLQPTINSLITKRIDYTEVGGMLGISVAFVSAANALAPVIGGALFQAVGPRAPFIFWSVLMGSLFVLALRRLTPGREERMERGLVRGKAHH